ncbi:MULTISPECIES: peptidoglycan recognition protein family protein [Paenibacillus]|uniref:N-acetylmuramoyl-L-alanine amidase n=1 Tax=Paenibacillus azoreducens TaxID=116718 RepID=A0A920CSQ5_9BACL|nr:MULTISPECIES: N-acetylmuramoyl-L-alanine amidase [Paenibacillus]MBE9912940.1 N-acetylmuramoyl-L-alanine amidase [Paenibacillus donghaensis]GIO47622.1 hypothetical protein J34TS1_23870 [Paenibacillus azoreducens]
MTFEGFIIHHSSCESINGVGYDFWIGADGSVTSAPLLTDPSHIHICLEGNFNRSYVLLGAAEKQQLFVASKLILELSRQYDISPLFIFPHTPACPGKDFPWNELVIYPAHGYH